LLRSATSCECHILPMLLTKPSDKKADVLEELKGGVLSKIDPGGNTIARSRVKVRFFVTRVADDDNNSKGRIRSHKADKFGLRGSAVLVLDHDAWS
jgi:hypothetical protein